MLTCSMTLILVIPGLLWPRQVMRDTLFDTDFPALQALLGKGRRELSGKSIAAWWCSYFGIAAAALPAAPLRLSACGGDPQDGAWLCVDPVHLKLGRRGATLENPAAITLDAAEAVQLHETLAPLFAGFGELVMTTPRYWHLRLAADAPALPSHLDNLIGQSAVDMLPSGAENRHWRQLVNDIQISLHAHPINAARQAHGLTMINSVALWGAGRMPALPAKSQEILLTDDPVIAGAGKAAGMRTMPVPTSLGDTRGDCTVHCELLRLPSISHDALAWREGLHALENDWLAPALSALSHGRLKRIELHAFGNDEAVSFSLSSFDRYRFWRKPRRLETL